MYETSSIVVQLSSQSLQQTQSQLIVEEQMKAVFNSSLSLFNSERLLFVRTIFEGDDGGDDLEAGVYPYRMDAVEVLECIIDKSYD